VSWPAREPARRGDHRWVRPSSGYRQVVTVGAATDLAVIGALTILLLTAGAWLFSYRERVR
jgi:hypothetical protein